MFLALAFIILSSKIKALFNLYHNSLGLKDKKGLQKKPTSFMPIKNNLETGKLFPRPSHLGKEAGKEMSD